MSVVACRVTKDKIEVASDSIDVRGWTQSTGKNISLSKLVKVNNMIVGSVGFAEECTLMHLFCITHSIKDTTIDSILTFLSEFSNWKGNKTTDGVINNEYIFVYGKRAFITSGYLVSEVLEYESIGAGMDYALTAMHLGHGAKEAVKVSCELSIFCEEPIIYFEEKL